MPPEEPHGGESVELRAFRGTRRTAVYRDHVLGADAFRRIVGAAQRKRLPLLSSLERRGAQELDKEGARRLAHELTRLRRSAEILELDEDVTALAEVARWCARAGGSAWLRIVWLSS